MVSRNVLQVRWVDRLKNSPEVFAVEWDPDKRELHVEMVNGEEHFVCDSDEEAAACWLFESIWGQDA